MSKLDCTFLDVPPLMREVSEFVVWLFSPDPCSNSTILHRPIKISLNESYDKMLRKVSTTTTNLSRKNLNLQ